MGGDFAGGVVGTDEGEEDDLKHDDATDEGADFGGVGEEGEGFGVLACGGDVEAEGEVTDGWESIPSEESDDEGEAEDEAEVEGELVWVAGEEEVAAVEEGEGLAEDGRRGMGLERGGIGVSG